MLKQRRQTKEEATIVCAAEVGNESSGDVREEAATSRDNCWLNFFIATLPTTGAGWTNAMIATNQDVGYNSIECFLLLFVVAVDSEKVLDVIGRWTHHRLLFTNRLMLHSCGSVSARGAFIGAGVPMFMIGKNLQGSFLHITFLPHSKENPAALRLRDFLVGADLSTPYGPEESQFQRPPTTSRTSTLFTTVQPSSLGMQKA